MARGSMLPSVNRIFSRCPRTARYDRISMDEIGEMEMSRFTRSDEKSDFGEDETAFGASSPPLRLR